MSKTSAFALTASLFWLPCGFLIYLILTMWLEHADKAPMMLQIIAAITLLCAVVLVALPVYVWMFVVTPVVAGSRTSGVSRQPMQDSVADESFADSEEFEADSFDSAEEDLGGQSSREFETLEFSDDEFGSFDDDFGDEFADDDFK